jgi:hypothetical protein
MTLVYPLLLGGLLLAGVPVLLHLFMRRKPTTLLFPAFRFLMEQKRANTRKLRLRHLLLLLLRMALIVLVVLALARPRVLHEAAGLSREKPVALVLVFDTSPSMDYKSGERSRLELAKRRCLELLDQLPAESRVLVLESSDAGAGREDWLPSLDRARQRVQGLTIRTGCAPINRAVDEAFRRLGKSDDLPETMPRMICVFSDRTRPSWDSAGVAKHGVSAQVLYFDVGVEEPIDLGITDAALSSGRITLTQGEKVSLRVGVRSVGIDPRASFSLGLHVHGKKIEQTFHLGQQTVSIPLDTKALGLGPGLHQAEVKLLSDRDALDCNNVRHISFAVKEPQRVLVLADDSAQADALVRALEANLFAVKLRQTSELGVESWSDFEAVFLAGVASPAEKLWVALKTFAENGGGVCVVPPGDALDRPAYGTAAARAVLPGAIQAKATAQNGAWSPGPAALEHPFLRRQQAWFVDFEYQSRRALHYWDVLPQSGGAVVVEYDDGKPAVLERLLGKSTGKVLLLTTPLDEATNWNNYYSNPHWFYPGLAQLCGRHLCKDVESVPLNFEFGKSVPVVARPGLFPKYLLTVGETSEEMVFEDGLWRGDRLPRPGNYAIAGVNAGETRTLHRFSINLPAEESDLSRVPMADLEAVLGVGAVVPISSRHSLPDTLQWDEPLDLFPWLMIALLFLLALESLLANRFYRQEPAPATDGHAVEGPAS